MTGPLPGRGVALVTGASAGIGKAIARRLLAEGWTVYGAARRVEQMADLRNAGARTVALDLTEEASLTAGVDRILAAEARIDALVNNAGYGSYGALEDVPLDEARRQFEVNVFGLMRLTQIVLPHMRAARRGTILNISSMGGRIWMPFGGWYHATKHAVEVLSDALRVEVRPFGIRVVIIQPGSIRSEWGPIAAAGLDERSRESPYRGAATPWIRVLRDPAQGSPPEVVAAVVARALASRNPRRRYAVPLDATVYIALRRILPDWAWEALIRLSVR